MNDAPEVGDRWEGCLVQRDFDSHVEAVGVAAGALAERAAAAGMDAPVPTCPGWTVSDLVAHQGVVHRWAAANLHQEDARIPSQQAVLHDVPRPALLEWFREGAARLLDTFATVAPDVAAMVFLPDAPRPREFWARRQAHETTIHAVDALSAALGRVPSSEEAGIGSELAHDGIDELLCGFITRGESKLSDGEPYTIAVAPTDSAAGWLIRVTPEGNVTTATPTAPTAPGARDAVFTGSSAQLYLGLWNRGTEITALGRTAVLDRWREVQQVR